MILVDTSIRVDHLRAVEHDEMLAFVEAHVLAGSGLGRINVHLLALATLAG